LDHRSPNREASRFSPAPGHPKRQHQADHRVGESF
jgi:hypothetical protein